MLQRKLLNRTGGKLHAAPGGAIRLGKHRDDLMFLHQFSQCTGCKLRSSCKNDVHVGSLKCLAPLLFELGADAGLFELRKVFDEYMAQQVIHLMLDTYGHQALGV